MSEPVRPPLGLTPEARAFWLARARRSLAEYVRRSKEAQARLQRLYAEEDAA